MDDRVKFGMIDLTGRRFGRLFVTGPSVTLAGGVSRWLCRCDCGVEKVVIGASLRRGATLSCGCLGREHRLAARIKHGAAARVGKSPEYAIWSAIKARCTNPRNAAYEHYGARGIALSEMWSDFTKFLNDMGPRPSSRHTIERVDNDKGYSVDNCIWATMQTQARNKRTNRAVIRDDGARFRTVVEAAESVGIHASGVRSVCIGKQSTAGGHRWSFAAAALLTALDKAQDHDH